MTVNSLFTVVLFCKVATNTELVNLEPLLLEEIQSYMHVSSWSQHFRQLVNTYPCFRCVSV